MARHVFTLKRIPRHERSVAFVDKDIMWLSNSADQCTQVTVDEFNKQHARFHTTCIAPPSSASIDELPNTQALSVTHVDDVAITDYGPSSESYLPKDIQLHARDNIGSLGR